MSSAQTEALVQALAPHLGGGGEEKARDAASRLPHTLRLGFGDNIGAPFRSQGRGALFGP